jgi:hypothetical protein
MMAVTSSRQWITSLTSQFNRDIKAFGYEKDLIFISIGPRPVQHQRWSRQQQ